MLDKLEKVRAIDPAAEQQLIAKLRDTPSDSWPLVAEQFRASLAYREQLASKRRQPRNNAAHTDSVAHDDAESAHNSPTNLLANSRPSAPIGQLVDPRDADSDGISSEALARSTPYSTPVSNQEYALSEEAESGPAEFTSDGPSYPIRAQHAEMESAMDTHHEVVQARFDAKDRSLDLSAASAAASEKTRPAASTLSDRDWRELVKLAADGLSRQAAASPATTAEVHQHVSLRMLHMLAGDTEKALEPIPHISPSEQDYWSRQLFALATYLDHHTQPDDKRRAAASVDSSRRGRFEPARARFAFPAQPVVLQKRLWLWRD